ncbi:MAG: NUDIX hydrolase [Candidatus Uhrbacteria bacterium]|nr:NUDIX hydrolase [Candidatus Uhrbacteria bacterium]
MTQDNSGQFIMRRWKKLSSKVVYSNPWYSIRKDKVIKPNGEPGEYNVIVRPPAVFIVPIDEKDNVYLVRVHRHTTQMYSIEIPAGGSDGQRPLTAAKRELMEEAGIKAKKWALLGKYQILNGLTDEIGYAYLAKDIEHIGENEKDMSEEGISRVIRIPFRRTLSMIKNGEITDGQSIVALSYAALKLGYTKI